MASPPQIVQASNTFASQSQSPVAIPGPVAPLTGSIIEHTPHMSGSIHDPSSTVFVAS